MAVQIPDDVPAENVTTMVWIAEAEVTRPAPTTEEATP